MRWLGPRDLALTVERYDTRDGGKTLVRTVSAFPSVDDRDAMIASGMERGVRDSAERLEELFPKLRVG